MCGDACEAGRMHRLIVEVPLWVGHLSANARTPPRFDSRTVAEQGPALRRSCWSDSLSSALGAQDSKSCIAQGRLSIPRDGRERHAALFATLLPKDWDQHVGASVWSHPLASPWSRHLAPPPAHLSREAAAAGDIGSMNGFMDAVRMRTRATQWPSQH